MTTVVSSYVVPDMCSILVYTRRKFNYVDSYRVTLNLRESLSVDYLLGRLFAVTPRWVDGLMAIRDRLVSVFGLKQGSAIVQPSEVTRNVRFQLNERACGITVCYRSDNELVMEESDRHLDFRVAFRACAELSGATTLELTTVVWCNNWLGALYFSVIKPFHRVIVKRLLTLACRELMLEFGVPRNSLVSPIVA
jgi:hypothetical protein